MTRYRRYAIYYAPREGAFLSALETWLGRSARPGVTVTPETLPALAACGTDLASVTSEPRRYGCHATLKAPFRLADGISPGDLTAALTRYAASEAPLRIDALQLSQIGRFFALTPVGDTSELEDFAFRIVRVFHPFAAPLSAEDIARRQPDRLTPRQRELLEQWSYPHVAEQFRFHVTLTNKVTPDCAELLRPELTRRLAPVLPAPLVIEDLCLFGETPDGTFELAARYPLTGTDQG